jgi:TolB-like protein/tetratricopeptide (TPR) repeat protein
VKIDNFFSELKRRNVYKVAVAYAVVAWLLIQAASILLPTFDAPPWTMKVLVLVLVLGFPAALIFSWAFEITPEGIKLESEIEPSKSIARRTGRKIVAVTIVLAVVGAGLFVFQFIRARSTSSVPTVGSAMTNKSIAVLPFDNLSRDPENAFFVEGVQEEILTRLAKVGELKVIARTSTQKFKSAPTDLREVAKQLDVTNILEGSVQKVNDQVRVNVQLINALTNAHLWAEIYDRKLTDIFAVESDIAKTIADTLQAKLTGSEKVAITTKPTENPEAHQFYLKGRYFWNRRTEENLNKAIGCFQQAIEKDPSYALAYAGLADCYGVMPYYVNRPPKNEIERGKAAARRAIELDDSLGEAHTALASLLMNDLQFAAAEAEFKRAFVLNPNYATAHQWYGDCLYSMGRFNEALIEAQRAHELDPLSLVISCVYAAIFDAAGHHDEALKQAGSVVELDPNFTFVYWIRGQIFENHGELDKAVADYEKAKGSLPRPACDAMIGCIYARTGRTGEARKILDQLLDESQQAYVPSYFLADIQAMLGNKEEALRLLEKAYDERSIRVGSGGPGGPKTDKRLDSLRDDPRFENLLAKFTGQMR